MLHNYADCGNSKILLQQDERVMAVPNLIKISTVKIYIRRAVSSSTMHAVRGLGELYLVQII